MPSEHAFASTQTLIGETNDAGLRLSASPPMALIASSAWRVGRFNVYIDLDVVMSYDWRYCLMNSRDWRLKQDLLAHASLGALII